MKNLRLLIWNDSLPIAESWAGIASADGFVEPRHSATTEPKELARTVLEWEPDLVVLDIIEDTTGHALGISMVSAVRDADLLVPVIAITREPEKIYTAKAEIEELGFAGIYHVSVVSRELFRDVAIRQSLNQWHALLPEYVLVRSAINAIRRVLQDKEAGFCRKLFDCLQRLPFASSIESWHKQLCETIAELMDSHRLPSIGARFVDLVSLFEKADPFYMAGSSARRHVSHNVQVFLLGLTVLSKFGEIQSKAVRSAAALDVSPESSFVKAVLVWASIALTHDVAYLSQKLPMVLEVLREIAGRFAPVIPGASLTCEHVSWPSVHHAQIGALLWEAEPTSLNERELFKLIGEGIRRHDSDQPNLKPVSTDNWPAFLAVLCDELQDWGRSRLTNAPNPNVFEGDPWRMFTLEVFRVDKLVGRTTITMDFIARDHPKIVAQFVGTSAPAVIKKRLREILSRLVANLRSSEDLEIRLAAHFVSRKVDSIIVSDSLKGD